MADQANEARWEDEKKARTLHATMDLIGLRAQATAVGFLQLCTELRSAGVIDEDAIGRIKTAIATDIIVSRSASRGRDEFELSLHKRLDAMFAEAEDAPGRPASVGSHEDLPAEFSRPDGARGAIVTGD